MSIIHIGMAVAMNPAMLGPELSRIHIGNHLLFGHGHEYDPVWIEHGEKHGIVQLVGAYLQETEMISVAVQHATLDLIADAVKSSVVVAVSAGLIVMSHLLHQLDGDPFVSGAPHFGAQPQQIHKW